jgi:hypothetical protein
MVNNFHQHSRYVFLGVDVVTIIEYDDRTMSVGSADRQWYGQDQETLRLSQSFGAGDPLSWRNRLCLTEAMMENAGV